MQRENLQSDRNLQGWLAPHAEHTTKPIFLLLKGGEYLLCSKFLMSVQKAHHGSGSLQQSYIYILVRLPLVYANDKFKI